MTSQITWRKLKQQWRRRLRKRKKNWKKIQKIQKKIQKLNLRCFQLYRAYSNSFNSWNVGKFFWSWIVKKLSKFRKRKRKSLSCVHVLDKTWNKVLFRYSRAATAKKCTKNLMQLHNCCLANLNLLLFCRSRCLRRCRCLSYLIDIKHLLVWLST